MTLSINCKLCQFSKWLRVKKNAWSRAHAAVLWNSRWFVQQNKNYCVVFLATRQKTFGKLRNNAKWKSYSGYQITNDCLRLVKRQVTIAWARARRGLKAFSDRRLIDWSDYFYLSVAHGSRSFLIIRNKKRLYVNKSDFKGSQAN